MVRLKSTGAVLVLASTSFVPEGEVGSFVGDEVKYNDKARLVMVKYGIAINDFHALTSNFEDSLFVGPGNVHYTKEGSLEIAAQVTEKIEQALKNSRQVALMAFRKDSILNRRGFLRAVGFDAVTMAKQLTARAAGMAQILK